MLIIKCDAMLRPEAFKDMAAEIARQCRGGSLVLPHSCHLVAEIPDGEEIKVVAERRPEIQDEIAVTLTREQWATIAHSLQFTVDDNENKRYWWANLCANKKMGAATAAQHEKTATAAAAILKIIEDTVAAPIFQEVTCGGD